MNKLIMAGIAGLALVSATANAISISGEAGEKYTNVGVGFGTETSGIAVTGNYAHNDDDGDIVGLGLGLNLPLGPFMGTVGGKGIYLNPKDGDEGYAVAVGGGLSWPVTDSFTVFGDYYYSPDSLSSGVKNYQEASAGARLSILRPVSIEAGYRYIGLDGKDGDRNNVIADGPYVGVSARF
ncbi:YfaZ family protein [Enterobacteriaceae bacterium H18W14]|uniref:YfaZ family outer membrane protein n=1 Tax=Dryocola boscaweniae TaxID=2925397 RepID=UPI0022EFE4A1|nr:YfaZ family outer membrane protein [Dryocola boscaweniae]MCT4716522.1 YfaZ family protein [Dryocola boscaweniae]